MRTWDKQGTRTREREIGVIDGVLAKDG